MDNTRDRLTELLNEANQRGDIIGTADTADYLIANGVILPPCKIGDKVYTKGHGNAKHPKEWTVVGAWLSADERCSYLHIHWFKDKDNFATRQVNFSEIGKTVFLTMEEAERALKGGVQE